MSTYLTRIIEVKLPDVVNRLYDKTKLPNIDNVNIGDVYEIRNYKGNEYIACRFVNGNKIWVTENTCNYCWKLLKYWVNYKDTYSEYPNETEQNTDRLFYKGITVDEVTDFSDCGGSLKYRYLSNSNIYNLSDRGIPNDVSDETRKLLSSCNSIWGHTYVTFAELESLYDNEKKRIYGLLEQRSRNSFLKTMSNKLNKICSKLGIESDDKEDQDEDYVDDYSYDDINDEIMDVENLNSEMSKIQLLVDSTFGYVSPENIRINYYFS